MKPVIIEGKGRVIVNALSTGEVCISVYSGSSGGMSAILTLKEAAEMSCGVTAAIKAAKHSPPL